MSCDSLKNLTLIRDINKNNGNYWSTFYHILNNFIPDFISYLFICTYLRMVNVPYHVEIYSVIENDILLSSQFYSVIYIIKIYLFIKDINSTQPTYGELSAEKHT